ncbi:MAG: aspartyl-trna synthetase [Marinicaulis sp.]|nr:hypothetical protein [Marinicaulis sp.]NNE41683.1 aspartyl-trna synthetase [Marinicaulis sp.]
MRLVFLPISIIIVFGAFAAANSADGAAPVEVRVDTPSGYPVPRFVSLKTSETYCRSGPSFSHPVRLTYKRRGLPVLVVAETSDHWRKIRDAESDECWIHRSKLSGAQTVLVRSERLPLRARPNYAAPAKAHLGGGVIARVSKVQDGWFFVTAKGAKGWAPERALWGAEISTLFSAAQN